MEEEQILTARRFKVLDRVKIKTTRFGKKFAKGLPIWTFGTIMKIKGKVCDVQWDDSEGVDLMNRLSGESRRWERRKCFDGDVPAERAVVR
jgi:hypothetical protein